MLPCLEPNGLWAVRSSIQAAERQSAPPHGRQLSSDLLTGSRIKNEQEREHPVQDARYLREQAARSLELASQISDRKAAEQLRLTAADYLTRAAEAEKSAASAFVPPRA